MRGFARPAVLLVLLMSVAYRAQEGPLHAGSVSGMVIDDMTERPLRNARVALSLNAGVIAAIADSNGVFALPAIPAGRHVFTATQIGYSGNRKLLSISSGEQLQNVTFRMSRLGVISGRVFDAGGQPAVGAVATLRHFTFTTEHGSRNAHAGQANTRLDFVPNLGGSVNAQGSFRIDHVEPGDYLVNIAPGANGTGAVLYPGTRDLSKASSVHVNPGEEVRLKDVNLAASPLGLIRARPIDLTGEKRAPEPHTTYAITVQDLSNSYALTRGGTDPQDLAVRPDWAGRYLVCARLSVMTSSREIEDRTGCVPVNYTGNEISTEIRIEKPTGRVSGRVFLESASGAAPKPFPGLLIHDENGPFTPNPMRFFSNADGSLASFSQWWPAGQAELVSFGYPEASADYYIESVRQGIRDVLREGLLILPVGESHMEVVVSAAGGVLFGNTSPHATVVLVPQKSLAVRSDKGNTYRIADADQHGNYEFKNLIPGEYRAYAVDRLEGFAYWDPPYLKPFDQGAKAIQIEKGRKHIVDVGVIARTN